MLGRHSGYFQGAFLKLNFLSFQKKNGQPAEEEERGWNHSELIARAHINSRDCRRHGQMDKNQYHQGIKNSRQQSTDEESENVIDAGVAATFEAEAVFDVLLRPRKQVGMARACISGW